MYIYKLTDLLNLYTIPLPNEIKNLLLQFSDHIRYGRRAVQYVLYV
jgi:hypothetical protein